MGARRALVCRLANHLPPAVLDLLGDFRLLVNLGVREALERNLTARGSLLPLAQRKAREFRVNFSHARIAMDTALSLDKGHRRHLRKGRGGSVPYVRRRFLIADSDTFHLDPNTGHVRLSLRPGEWAGFDLVLSDWHRSVIASAEIKQLRLNLDRAILIVEKRVPEPYSPKSLLALDTNESSLDGVLARSGDVIPVRAPYPDVRRVQNVHFVRRRKLGRKKAHDRRVGRKLVGREGQRERARVTQRLHLLSKGLVADAWDLRSAITLEDLHLPRGGGRGPRMRRRLASWPQRELHRQIEYKAEERGVPVLKVNPAYTSKTCPKCGEIKDRRSRVGRMFVCARCGWRCDRQLNAGLNICRTALQELPEGAMSGALGGLVLDPDALANEVVSLRYAPGHAGTHEGSGRSGRHELTDQEVSCQSPFGGNVCPGSRRSAVSTPAMAATAGATRSTSRRRPRGPRRARGTP